MTCHTTAAVSSGPFASLIILAGQPNVGKSVLFKRLTGRYATVSNYPGTTVEVTQGEIVLDGRPTLVVDAPGINSLTSMSDDERVTRDLLLTRSPDIVVQVADAKNLARALFLTLQFAEMDAPLVLALNMMDEAERRGVRIDTQRLADMVGIQVVPTIATRGEGVATLVGALAAADVPHLRMTYSPPVEAAIASVTRLLPTHQVGRRGRAVMLLAGDASDIDDLPVAAVAALDEARAALRNELGRPVAHTIAQERWQAVADLVPKVLTRQARPATTWRERIGRWTIDPILGWPILMAVLVLIYKFVGEFGAGTLVDWLEGTVIQGWLLPPIISGLSASSLPPLLQDFLVGEYGLLTMGLSYAIGIVLPIVTTFFIAFGILEDSGYLPRLAVIVNRGFNVLGLNGKAVLPMVLGLGCVTMATMTTRILGTRKERILATLLLALSIPCSAQLGVILAMTAWLTPVGLGLWAAVVMGVLLLVGWLAARVIPGERSDFILELPPLRLPEPGNIALKTVTRVEWYLKEVIPLFLLATVGLFALSYSGILTYVEQAMSPLVQGWLGLPAETSGMFLLGFLRRDYGAVGLFDLARNGQLSPHQVLVSLVVVTLFVPCVATVMMMIKEHGWKVGVAICAFVFPFAFLVGGLVNRLGGF